MINKVGGNLSAFQTSPIYLACIILYSALLKNWWQYCKVGHYCLTINDIGKTKAMDSPAPYQSIQAVLLLP